MEPRLNSRADWQPELRTLRYFVCVAEEKSLTAAAARLRIAQPALSRQIRQLEDGLGTQVFRRTPRGVDLTEAGAILLGRAYSILAQVQQAHHDVTAQVSAPRRHCPVGRPDHFEAVTGGRMRQAHQWQAQGSGGPERIGRQGPGNSRCAGRAAFPGRVGWLDRFAATEPAFKHTEAPK